MHILALETTGKYGSAAVIDGDGNVFSAASHEEMNHLCEIIELADRCLSEAGTGKKDLTHVAASIGPGSFTGIRIGVTTARALSQALGIPCLAVRTLEVMARGAALSDAARESGADHICTIINARRRQTYGAFWTTDGRGGYAEERTQKQYMIDEITGIASGLGGKVLFTGDGIDAYEDILREAGFDMFAPVETRYQSAEAAARIALEMAREGGHELGYDELLPDYMRKSEAEMRLENGTLSRKTGPVK
jgi:tRNA threonylcarbamoyladenosine biosynthesis protein TsaB